LIYKKEDTMPTSNRNRLFSRLVVAVVLAALLLATFLGTGSSRAAATTPTANRPPGPAPVHEGAELVGPINRGGRTASSVLGDGSWTPTGGPTFVGGQVNALAVHRVLSGTLYAAVQAAPDPGWGNPTTIYRSSDGAASWTAVYTIPTSVSSLAVTDTVVYAGAYNRDAGSPHPVIYCSTDGGLNWTAPLSFSNGTIWALGVHPTLTGTAAAGGGDYPDVAYLYQTTDAGATWNEVFSYTLQGWAPTVNAALIHPTDPLNWLLSHDGQVAGTWGSYIWQSLDGGATWTRVYTVSEDIVYSLVANPVTPTIIYAGTWQDNLYRSTDSGATWTAVITDGSAGQQLVVEPPATLYTITGKEVRKSTNGGDSWSFAGQQGDLRSLAIDLGPTPAALYLGTAISGVSKSSNGGQDWEERNNGIVSPARPRDVAVDPENPGKLFAAAGCAGAWRSPDGGATWIGYNDLPGCMGSFGINRWDSDEVYAGAYNCAGATIFHSMDGGLTFAPAFTPTFVVTDCSAGGENIFAVGVAPSMTRTVYAVGEDYPNWTDYHAVVVRSLDGGVSWTTAFTLPASSQATTGAIDPQDDTTAYVGGRDCSAGPCHGFIYRTTDGGENWLLALTDTESVRSVIVDYQKPNVLYAATDSYRVYKSTDSGDSWTVVRYPPWEPGGGVSGNRLAIDPHVPSHIYLGGWGYIGESTDGGATWSEGDDPINLGTPPREPADLRLDWGIVTQTLYAAFDGVWSYSRPAPQPGEPEAITMWTVPISDPLYYANGINGVMYYALVLDPYENWVVNGTPVTVTYDLSEIGEGQFNLLKHTQNGQVQGGLFGVSVAGTVTFTAKANVTATAFVTVTFIYNPPAGITITTAPVSMTVGGATALLTATVPGLHDGIASNGTVVTWETSLGTIVTTTLTTAGAATTTLTSGDLAGTAVVTATVDGYLDTTTVEFVGVGYQIYLPLVCRGCP
jgi:photosystem II stability/assembly factor-like uncharacterized protein